MNQPSGQQQQWILAGKDAEILPMLERCRRSGRVRVVGLWGESDSYAATYASIMGIRFESTPGRREDLRDVGIVVAAESREWVPDDIDQISYSQARERLSVPRPAPRGVSQSLSASPAHGGSGGSSHIPPRGGDGGFRDDGESGRERAAGDPFATELEREILRSKRYHLGFTLTLIQLRDEAGKPSSPAEYRQSALKRLPGRIGRETDSWGVDSDASLLHLAPEIHEQATLMRRRLLAALQAECGKLAGGPWSLRVGQAIFPDDGESSAELLGVARQRLARSQVLREAGA